MFISSRLSHPHFRDEECLRGGCWGPSRARWSWQLVVAWREVRVRAGVHVAAGSNPERRFFSGFTLKASPSPLLVPPLLPARPVLPFRPPTIPTPPQPPTPPRGRRP
jgi:hypothetical protein